VRFVHLKAQATATEWAVNKARELVERIAAFCRSVNGKADVFDEGLAYKVTCTLPSRVDIEMQSIAELGTVDIAVGSRRLAIRDPPNMVMYLFSSATCTGNVSRRTSGGVKCSTKADSFDVYVGKNYEDMSINVPR